MKSERFINVNFDVEFVNVVLKVGVVDGPQQPGSNVKKNIFQIVMSILISKIVPSTTFVV